MILGILQARVSSSRLPGKVMKDILGKPMLLHQLERLSRSAKIDKLVVASSDDPADAVISEVCERAKVDFFQGSLEDVLDRFYQCASKYNPDVVVRLTGDCPLIDPEVVDHTIDVLRESGADYASNTIEPTYPDGLDVEAFRFSALEKAWREATLQSHREHVTPFIISQPEKFTLAKVQNKDDLSDLRWTVDEPEDFDLVVKIYEALSQEGRWFSTDDVLTLLDDRPELRRLNSDFERNEGLKKSQENDKMAGPQ